jgi:hypothetical protein
MTESALLWLIQFADSSEIQWGLLRPTTTNPLQGSQSPATAIVPASYVEQDRSFESQNSDQPQRLPTTLPSTGSALDATNRAIKLGDFVRRTRPTLYADPVIRFPLAAAQRKRGMKREALHYWQQLSTSELTVEWRQSARGELWLEEPRGYPPKPTVPCTRTREKPYLDGRLNEPFWAGCEAANLVSALSDDQVWPAFVHLAYDADYLYLGVHCRKAPGFAYEASDQTRPLDPDLSRQDRVELLLDLDRDYATYFSLTVDHRGWVRDSCVDDARWNPSWHVAASSDDTSWTVEAAIALTELSPQLTANTTWALGIQRVVPNVGFQSWTRPAAVVVRPEGFGYLRFDNRRLK